jgi:hypothetical protein
VRAAVLTRSSPIQNRRRSPSTWTSQRAPAWWRNTDLLPGHAHDPLAQTRRLTHPVPLRSVWAAVDVEGGAAGPPALNR